MLVGLAIRDVVLIDRLAVDLPAGLSVLTGETGAGKSILLDALGLALGARGDGALIRHGAEQAVVSAEFEPPAGHAVHELLIQSGLEAGGRLTLRRTLARDRKSRAFVNDQPVGVTLLRRIGAELVEIHGQFETYGLIDPRTHRQVLDSHAAAAAQAAAVAAAWQAWRDAETARAETALRAARARAEEAELAEIVAELDELAAEPGEEARLIAERAVLVHREKLVEAIAAAHADLGGERGAERLIGTAARGLARVADKAGGRLDAALAALDRAGAETAEALARLEAASADLELDADALERSEARLFALRAVARKHEVAPDRLPEVRASAADRLALIADRAAALVAAETAAGAARAAYLDAAAALSGVRIAAAARLDAEVAAELAPLKLDRARFVTTLTPLAEPEWGPHGVERVTFEVATLPGAPPGPLNRIASGGELARFMLALKVVLARASVVPTLVFDEVDAGIGGAVAAAVGERLDRLGRDLQVLVVTHSPQVAARGGSHFKVMKTAAAGDRVTAALVRLDPDARREEIARMLSGARITDQARAAADALLG